MNLAETLDRLSRLPEAVQWAKHGMTLGMKENRVLTELANKCSAAGHGLFTQRRYLDAHKYYLDAVNLNPNNGVLRSNLAVTFHQLGDHRQAVEQARLGIQLGCRQHWIYGVLGLRP